MKRGEGLGAYNEVITTLPVSRNVTTNNHAPSPKPWPQRLQQAYSLNQPSNYYLGKAAELLIACTEKMN
jgi:hypothetical protein